MTDQITEKYEQLKGAELNLENLPVIMSLLGSEQWRINKESEEINFGEARKIAAGRIGAILKPVCTSAEVMTFISKNIQNKRRKASKPKGNGPEKMSKKSEKALDENPIRKALLVGQAEIVQDEPKPMTLTDYLEAELADLAPGQVKELVFESPAICSTSRYAINHVARRLKWPSINGKMAFMSRSVGRYLYVARLR